jgi:hypothetical protein
MSIESIVSRLETMGDEFAVPFFWLKRNRRIFLGGFPITIPCWICGMVCIMLAYALFAALFGIVESLSDFWNREP